MTTAGPSTQALATSSTTQRLTTKTSPVIPSSSSISAGRARTIIAGNAGSIAVKDVVSPGELCGFVDTLLSQLETRFDEMSEQVLGRMNEMSNRIDNLETTIQDLMATGIDEGAAQKPVSAGKR